MNIEQITQRLHAIRDRNDWQRFHSPKNLAMAASVEMAELVEIFQWQTEDESRQLSADKLEHAGQEKTRKEEADGKARTAEMATTQAIEAAEASRSEEALEALRIVKAAQPPWILSPAPSWINM